MKMVKERTIEVLSKDMCCGCGACYNACPAGAIQMREDGEGFIVPFIDGQKCISCGLCKSVCPVLNTKYKNTNEPDCYAVMADDDIRKTSSSGGMFTLAAENIIGKGGYVCGCVLNSEFNAEHTIVSQKSELEPMRGSKYIQSNTGTTFSEIKKLLEQDKTVLFTGCPCQVAGLYGFLKKDYEKLFTIDLVCHGTPTPKAFRKYLNEAYGIENLKDFKFRTKEFGYNSFHQTAYLKSGEKISSNVKFDYYEKGMHSGLLLKHICWECPFASAPRQADLSIGDFWGIVKHDPALNDDKGTSLVLINSDKGRRLFREVQKNALITQRVPFEFARANNRFSKNMRIPQGRNWFFHMNKYQPYHKAAEYALNRHFDIGVIGLWYGRNYGSMATYYALHQTLKYQLGLSVLMIENALKPDTENELTKTHPRKIAKAFYDVSLKYPIAEMNKLNQYCDTFLVGSDQLWNIGLSRPYGQTYFLGFADDDKKKIAYGTSFGKPYEGRPDERLTSSFNLSRFDAVSVRDKLSKDICENLFNIEAKQVCDPTFLCPVSEYEKLIRKAKIEYKEDYILAYILDTNKEFGELLRNTAQKTKKKIYVILDESPNVREINKQRLELRENDNVEVLTEVDLYEFMWYYKHAQAVLTDSFHGTIFSIIFQKPFLSKVNVNRGAQRFVSLLEPLELLSRLKENPEEMFAGLKLLKKLDYTEVNEKLEIIRKNSYEWLKQAIFSPKAVKNNRVYKFWSEDISKE